EADDGSLPVVAIWTAPGSTELSDGADRLPVSNLALRDQRTIAVADVEELPELTSPSLGGLERLRELGARAVLATPIVSQGRALAAHRDVARAWTHSETMLIETVAAEAGVTIRLGRLLEENRERIAQQTALLRAAQVLSGELELGTVLQRLVDELAALVDADASDCYLYDTERGALRCAAVHGFDQSLVGFEVGATRGLAGLAIREGQAKIGSEYQELADPVPHEAYQGFTDALVAPMRWSDGVQGVLGVGRRNGRSFGRRDAEVLDAFAVLASLALRNAE